MSSTSFFWLKRAEKKGKLVFSVVYVFFGSAGYCPQLLLYLLFASTMAARKPMTPITMRRLKMVLHSGFCWNHSSRGKVAVMTSHPP